MEKEVESFNEIVRVVKEAVETTTGIEWEAFVASYLKKNEDQEDLSEVDLAMEILVSGGYQDEGDATLEDVVMIGAHVMGEDLGLFG